MSDDKFSTMAFKSAGDDEAQGNTRSGESGQTGQQAATRRTVGIYERPAARTRLSLPILVILILASIISLILSIRFLF
jgi:hypothetical protein